MNELHDAICKIEKLNIQLLKVITKQMLYYTIKFRFLKEQNPIKFFKKTP